MRWFSTFVLAAIAVSTGRADVVPNPIFSDNMVLQRGTAVPVPTGVPYVVLDFNESAIEIATLASTIPTSHIAEACSPPRMRVSRSG